MRVDSDIVRMPASDSPARGSGCSLRVVFSFNSMI
jgi:hypothetical protein